MDLVGAHVAPKRAKTYLDKIKYGFEDLHIQTIQIFISSPQSVAISKAEPAELRKIKQYVEKNKINLFAHAKYIINLSQPSKFPASLYRQELDILYQMGGITSTVHTGKQRIKGQELPYETAFQNMVKNIRYTLATLNNPIPVCIETPAGAGSEILTTTEEMARFYKAFSPKEKKQITFCIDTCHIFASGYDIRTKKGMAEYLSNWDKLIGLNKVACIQLNDSKFPVGSKRDRHEIIGEGFIGNPEFGGSPYGFIELFRIAYKHRIPLVIERCGKDIENQIEEIEKIKKIMGVLSSSRAKRK